MFSHNLRHLFARTYYRIYRYIVKLADVLDHSSVETTRIYLISTSQEHARQMDWLGLAAREAEYLVCSNLGDIGSEANRRNVK